MLTLEPNQTPFRAGILVSFSLRVLSVSVVLGRFHADWAHNIGLEILRPVLGLWVLQARPYSLSYKLIFSMLFLPSLHGFSEGLCRLPTMLLFPAGYCVAQGCHTEKARGPVLLHKQYLSVHCGLTKTTKWKKARYRDKILENSYTYQESSLSSTSLWANLGKVTIICISMKTWCSFGHTH